MIPDDDFTVPTDILAYWPTHEAKYRNRERMLGFEEGREELGRTLATRPLVKLWESMQTDGMINPIIVRMVVKVGNQRLMCARALKIPEVKVVVARSPLHVNDLREAYKSLHYDIHTDAWEDY